MSEQIQHKLYNYHAQPPGETWDKIASALDTETSNRLSEKLFSYEVKPPSFVWDNIITSLERTATPVIPLYKRFSKSFRYISAAASLLAIALVVNLIFNKKSAPTESMALPGSEQNSLPPTFPPVTEKMSLGFSNNATRTNGGPAKSMVEHKRKKSQKMPLLNYAPSTNAEELADRVVQHHYSIEEPQFLDRYLIFSKASGEAFRLSKKLFHLFACSDNDENCKQLIVSMQEQMADPSITLAGDFPAVLAVLQNMDNE